MEFIKFQAWKFVEFKGRSWKVMEKQFYLGFWQIKRQKDTKFEK